MVFLVPEHVSLFPFLSLIRNDAQVVWCPKDQRKSTWRRKQLESGQKKGRSW